MRYNTSSPTGAQLWFYRSKNFSVTSQRKINIFLEVIFFSMNEFVLNGMFLKFFALPWKFIFSLLTLKLYLLQWKIHPFPHILTSIISPMRKSRRGVKQ